MKKFLEKNRELTTPQKNIIEELKRQIKRKIEIMDYKTSVILSKTYGCENYENNR